MAREKLLLPPEEPPRGDPLDEAAFWESEHSKLKLPYDFDLAVLMYDAWEKHGRMPKAGGILDQPRAWLHMIRIFNRVQNRHVRVLNPANRAAMNDAWWEEFAKKAADDY